MENRNDSNDIYTISVNDINNIQSKKSEKRLKLYKKLSEKCFLRIKNAVLKEETYCYFVVKQYYIGYPLYNMSEFIIYTIDVLKNKGFHAFHIKPNIIYISWSIKKKQLTIEDSSQKAYKDVFINKPKFRDINSYKPSGNFIFN